MIRLLLLLCLLTSITTAQQRLTLDDALRLADDHAEAIRIGRLAVDQAQLSTDIASAARWPKVDLSASYSHVSKYGSIEFAIPGLPIPPRSISFGDGNVYETAVTASVPLFAGFRISETITLQREQTRMAQQTLDGVRTDVRTAVILQYRAAQLAGRSIAIVDAQQELVRSLLAQRVALMRQGQALASDTLAIAARVEQLGVDRMNAANQYNKAVLSLEQLTGLRGPFTIDDAMEANDDLSMIPLDSLVALALDSRADARNLRSSKASAAIATRIAESSLYPSVYASASYRYGRPGVDQIRNHWMDYYTAGLRLEWNLWSWKGDERTIERSAIEAEKTALREEQLAAQVRTHIASLLEDIAARRQMAASLETQIRLEREKLAIARSRSVEGLATVTDVLDAETAVTTALLRLEQTRIDSAMKLTELSAAIGRAM